ncbi:hypothetical protein PR002_g11406 [Phytophthora rubi]|nr:hypothetical protein PR002_g11406 [Phytophthora rubi]
MWDLVAIVKEIQNIGQPAEAEEASPCWLTRWIYRGAETASPNLRSSFFFLGPSGSASYFGKKVCAAATLCLPSVGKLAHCDSVLKVGTILQGGRYVPNSELGAIPKRVIAKVRSIDPNSSRAGF